MSKRRLLAKSMDVLGITRCLEALSPHPGILVINHHRIGHSERSRFDRGVFSATIDELEAQVRYVKRRFPIVCGEEMRNLLAQPESLDRLYVVFTFDDGYLDNYTKALPVFKANACGAIFFLVPSYVGSQAIPWWDEIAYYVRHSERKLLSLETPVPLTIELDSARETAIYKVLQHYKRPDNTNGMQFLSELQSASGCQLPTVDRRFLDWAEMRDMHQGGMEIGSHTVSHRILSQLSSQEQMVELSNSKLDIQQQLGSEVSSLAYPVGLPSSFTPETERLARAAGYSACFSFFGGLNHLQHWNPTNLLRMSADPDRMMFRHEITLMAQLGKSPYN